MLLALAVLVYLSGSERALSPQQASASAAPAIAQNAPQVIEVPRLPLIPHLPVAPTRAAEVRALWGAAPAPAPGAQVAVPPPGGSAPAATDPGLSAPPIGVVPTRCAFSGKVTLLALGDGKPRSPEGRVVVYVRTVPQEEWKPTVSPPVEVFQEPIAPDDYKFSESVRVVVVGDAIDFVNKPAKDEHNVFSGTTMTFEIPRNSRYSTGTHRFTQQGTYHVQCDIHESMRLDVLAVKNPFFAPADAKGNYTLKPLPPGEYKLVAWERNGAELEIPVSCPTNGPVDFQLKEAPPPPHRHIDRRPWGGHGTGPW